MTTQLNTWEHGRKTKQLNWEERLINWKCPDWDNEDIWAVTGDEWEDVCVCVNVCVLRET